jgi:aminomethyltransferase
MADPIHARELPLHQKHLSMEARMGDHAGWAVPMSYTGPLEEASAATESGVVTDVSYLSRIRIRGDAALDLLERACTHDVAHQEDDTAAVSCLCNERGGVVDLGYLLRLDRHWLWTGDAGNRRKTFEHLTALADGLDVTVTDRTEHTAQLAVLGPEAGRRLDAVLPFTVSDLPGGAVKAGSLLVARYTATRTAYADTWGLEVILPAMMAGQAWRFITDKAGENALPPMGLAGRDILRIRAGLPRYGHEVNETVDPISAGLERCVDLGHEFIGRDAIEAVVHRGPARRVKMLSLTPPEGVSAAQAIPRLGDEVLDDDGAELGRVTSGTLAGEPPAPIALALLGLAAHPGATLTIRTSAGDVPARCLPSR